MSIIYVCDKCNSRIELGAKIPSMRCPKCKMPMHIQEAEIENASTVTAPMSPTPQPALADIAKPDLNQHIANNADTDRKVFLQKLEEEIAAIRKEEMVKLEREKATMMQEASEKCRLMQEDFQKKLAAEQEKARAEIEKQSADAIAKLEDEQAEKRKTLEAAEKEISERQKLLEEKLSSASSKDEELKKATEKLEQIKKESEEAIRNAEKQAIDMRKADIDQASAVKKLNALMLNLPVAVGLYALYMALRSQDQLQRGLSVAALALTVIYLAFAISRIISKK